MVSHSVKNVLKIGNEPLEKETVTKFLGVCVDQKFSWVDHINYLKRKLLCEMSAINKIKLYTIRVTVPNQTLHFTLSGLPFHYTR